MQTLRNYVKQGGFYKAVVEDGSDLIFIVDYEGQILYHNNSVKETLGYGSNTLVSKNFFDFILPETLVDFKKAYLASTKKRFNESIEFQFLCKDKSYKYLEFNSINLFHSEKIKGLILDCRDIAQRKKDAEELLRAQKAKELFLANISHEIRTPINGIAGLASLLSSNQNVSGQSTYLSAIQSAADNLKVIINDILDLASIESGKLKFEQIGFNMNDLLHSLINIFLLQANEKKIDLRYHLHEDANKIFIGDPVRLNQILLNLINNALKFTNSGYISVNCYVKKKEAKKYLLEFEVRDTGIGIPKDKLQTIFESFSQADASVTRKYGGTGLGLTIVRQLIELQNGSIHVVSKEGLGSTFSFTIPYQLGSKANIRGNLVKDSSFLKKSLKDLSVLLVEDNDVNRLYASSILKIWDCKIDMAENGYVAFEKIKNELYDIILMDIQMPVMDGFEATKAIRGLESSKKNLPIIALTANATRATIEQCLAHGMNDCISKPFTPEDLYNKLSHYKKNEQRKIEQSKTIDLSYLQKMSNNNKKFIDEMLSAFVESLPKSIDEITNYYNIKDWQALARAVHKLKPSLTLMGLHTAREQALVLEELAKQNKPTKQIGTYTQLLCASLSQALLELKEIV
ncbi:MAG: response regulator [Bacteroidetes bacterium]|nr:response regulator [Bacteroidota bacterium]